MGFFPAALRKMKFFRRKDKQKDLQRQDGFRAKDPRAAAARDSYGGDAYARGNSYGHGHGYGHGAGAGRLHAPSPASSRLMAYLPDPILERIFTFVCPHTADETYETHEQSSLDDACMLCDLRDLAHCVAVCRQWRRPAQRRLYHSIRIDAVHFCEREIYLSDKRKRRSFFDRNGNPEDPAQARLKLLCRTLRDDPTRLGILVHYFKIPYMLRESCQADLARTIAVLPNLLYVDLPEGLFADEHSYLTLRLEVQARCRHLRKMTYMGGAERSFEQLATGIWPELVSLELTRLQADPVTVRHVLGSLHGLQALKVSEMPAFVDDVLFQHNEMVPPFPALEELILKDTPNLTAEGLNQHLADPHARMSLKSLSLTNTGVGIWDLHEVLNNATSLTTLVVVASVAQPLPTAAGTHRIAPLRSRSLQTLNWEITAAPSAGVLGGNATSSYYNYLSGSLLSGGLPTLSTVYVRDLNFPDSLLGMPMPPAPAFAGGAFAARPSTSGSSSGAAGGFGSPRNFLAPGSPASPPTLKPFAPTHNPRFSSNNPFAAMIPTQQMQTLEVFTKGDDELDWSIVRVDGGADPLGGYLGGGGGGGGGHRRGSSFGMIGLPERPHSSYGLSSDGAQSWGATAGARKSVFLGDGAGGFLAVPDTPSGGQPSAHVPAERRGSSSSARRPNFGATGGWSGGSGGASAGADEWPAPYSPPDRKKDRKDLWR